MSTTMRALEVPRITACAWTIIISRVTGRVVSIPCHDHAEGIAHQDEVAMRIEDAGGMGVVGRQRDDLGAFGLALGEVHGTDAA